MGLRTWAWEAVHNAIAHPLLIINADWAVRFHNWTSDKAWPPEDPIEDQTGGYDRDDLEVRLGAHFECMEIMGTLLAQHDMKDEFLAVLDEAEAKVDVMFKEHLEAEKSEEA